MISNNKDMTLQPRFYFNNDILLQNEYRQVEKNLNHISDFSVKKSEQNSKFRGKSLILTLNLRN